MSRARARELIDAGKVRVAGATSRKPAALVAASDEIVLEEPDHPYVSRGALKLAGAVADFQLTLKGKTALDVGASTGGFTDFLLSAGAARVYCVDVGKGQLHEKLRTDPRVEYWESADIRGFSPGILAANIDIMTVDVSFISLTKVVPALAKFPRAEAELIALVKPQFEVGKAKLGKGGLVKDEAAVQRCCEENGFAVEGIVPSRLKGGDGNQEYFIYAKKK